MRVDYGGDGVGGVVEPVYELEPQGDEQRQRKKQKWDPRCGFDMRALNVRIKAIAGEDYATDKQDYESDGHAGMHAPVQIGTRWASDERGSGNVDHVAHLDLTPGRASAKRRSMTAV
jgi:hypothetical protein